MDEAKEHFELLTSRCLIIIKISLETMASEVKQRYNDVKVKEVGTFCE